MVGRRTLQLTSLDDVIPEVDRLLQGGYRTVGNWSLGQACNHLALAIQGSVEGFAGAAPWPVRASLGRLMKRRILSRGKMPERAKLPEEFHPREGLDDRAEAEALRAAIRLFGQHAGAMADHPFFGPTLPEEWQQFHTIHAAHHLGFIIPEPSAAV